jgi:hypothetical protein
MITATPTTTGSGSPSIGLAALTLPSLDSDSSAYRSSLGPPSDESSDSQKMAAEVYPVVLALLEGTVGAIR